MSATDIAIDGEYRLLRAIASPHFKRRDIVEIYCHVLLTGEGVDWDRVHRAIIERWSYFAVEWIRREAGKAAPERPGGEG